MLVSLTKNKQLQNDESSSGKVLYYDGEVAKTTKPKTKDGHVVKHRKHLSASPHPQSRAA